ncbi:GCN5-related N-acetyltransferase [Actinobacteria bacterium OK074]|nr:GCN5-related N-acetyltransferase [Actinobacteria bacterium OK074]
MLVPAPIRTSRLDLVPLRPEHAEEMAAVLADPALYAFTGGGPRALAALRARYERLTAGSPDPAVSWCNWVLRTRTGDGRLSGTVQATVVAGVAEVAWVVGAAWQGRGYATEAARGLVAWLGGRGVVGVLAHIHPEHHVSAAVAAAVGLAPTDRWEGGEIRWEGAAVTTTPASPAP